MHSYIPGWVSTAETGYGWEDSFKVNLEKPHMNEFFQRLSGERESEGLVPFEVFENSRLRAFPNCIGNDTIINN